jgi:hypothetical protein
MATTQYWNYGFNSFCIFNGVPLGACEDGIFQLDSGSNDNGTKISAFFETVKTDFGSSNGKRARRFLVGYEATGDLSITATVDDSFDSEIQFSVPSSYDRSSSLGLKVAGDRSVMGRYWSVKVANVSGSDFAIDSIQVQMQFIPIRNL